jgi:two-component system response regulator ChvI
MSAAVDAGNLTHSPALAEAAKRVVIVDDDALFRESLGLNLVENGYQIEDFGDGESALRHFDSGGAADAILLDWRMPGVDGLGVLRQLRTRDVQVPVIFLTVLSDEIYEEAALRWGAVDFIEKSRSLSIILQRLRLITDGAKGGVGAELSADSPVVFSRGGLELRNDIKRAFYSAQRVDLTLTEFQIVHLLATAKDTDVSYRQIYDLVRGKDFIAGYGEDGYRVNVRSFIKRIRQKFRDVDDSFECIENYPGFGYRWVDQA